jgi:hypothetical protein
MRSVICLLLTSIRRLTINLGHEWSEAKQSPIDKKGFHDLPHLS